MLVTGKMDYKAGGWPGSVYHGEVEVSVNLSEEEDDSEVIETLAIRGRQKIAEKMCMTTASVHISNIKVTSRKS